MSEPTSDALFGVDGTQAPEPLPDPSAGPGRGSWRDTPELPPMPLPPLPDLSAMREAIAAALGDDADVPAGAVDQDPAAAPASQAAPQPAGQPTVPDANVPEVNVAAPPHSTTSAGASTGAPAGRPAPTEAGDRSSPRRLTVSALIPPAPSQLRRPGGLRYRPPMAGASREFMPLTDLRRRIRRERIDLPLRSGSNGGATAFFLVMLIIIGLLVYNIVTGFLDSLSRFLP